MKWLSDTAEVVTSEYREKENNVCRTRKTDVKKYRKYRKMEGKISVSCLLATYRKSKTNLLAFEHIHQRQETEKSEAGTEEM
jgi:hypothetical protein